MRTFVRTEKVAPESDGVKTAGVRHIPRFPTRECAGEDLNLHGPTAHKALNLARLPIPPPALASAIVAAAWQSLGRRRGNLPVPPNPFPWSASRTDRLRGRKKHPPLRVLWIARQVKGARDVRKLDH